MGLAKTAWGTILLVETATRNLSYIPAGFLVDHLGRRTCILMALTIPLLLVPSFVFLTGFWSVLIIRIVMAMSHALLMPAASAMVADCVPREIRGRVMAAVGRGTFMLGAASGGTGGPGLAT